MSNASKKEIRELIKRKMKLFTSTFGSNVNIYILMLKQVTNNSVVIFKKFTFCKVTGFDIYH